MLINTWLAGLYSEKPVVIPPHITAVLIQRAANALGQLQPQVMPEGREPDFIAEAELQMYVVDLVTKFCVFPRVIGRGNAPLIELANSPRRFNRQTAEFSGWSFRLGYAGRVFEPPAIPEAARDADETADLTPRGTRSKQNDSVSQRWRWSKVLRILDHHQSWARGPPVQPETAKPTMRPSLAD